MNKILLIALIAIVGFTTQVNAQAKIKFKSETVDYGEIIKGSDGVRTFEFTNVGDEPLIISQVKSSCGCTVPSKPDKPIAPGASDVIKVKYDTKRVGPIRKTVTVYSNAERSTVSLKIKGKVNEAGNSVLEKKS